MRLVSFVRVGLLFLKLSEPLFMRHHGIASTSSSMDYAHSTFMFVLRSWENASVHA